MIVCKLCCIHWSIEALRKEELTEKENEFICACCKLDERVTKAQVRQKEKSAPSVANQTVAIRVININETASSDSSSKNVASSLSVTANIKEQESEPRMVQSLFRVYRSTNQISCSNKSPGSSLPNEADVMHKAKPTNSAATKLGDSKYKPHPFFFRVPGYSSFVPAGCGREILPSALSKKAVGATILREASPRAKIVEMCREATTQPFPLLPDLRKFVACRNSRELRKDAKPFTSRITVIGAECISQTVCLLQDYCPHHKITFEQTYTDCLDSLNRVIDKILPKMIVIIQLGEMDLLKYEFGDMGVWVNTFEGFIARMVEKHVFVYVSFLQPQTAAIDYWYYKAIQFNKIVKTISERNNAYFINVLLKFWGHVWLFNYKGNCLSQLGDDLLLSEWGQHIAEVPHLRNAYLKNFYGIKSVPRQFHAQEVYPGDPRLQASHNKFTPIKEEIYDKAIDKVPVHKVQNSVKNAYQIYAPVKDFDQIYGPVMNSNQIYGPVNDANHPLRGSLV